jgi:hypothetical protein
LLARTIWCSRVLAMVKFPSLDDESFKEAEADARLIRALEMRDLAAISAAIIAGAPHGDTAKLVLSRYFDPEEETTWVLRFRKRGGKGRPPSEQHRERQTRIYREIDVCVVLEKDGNCEMVLRPGAFEGFIQQVRDNLSAKYDMRVTASEVKAIWTRYADDTMIKHPASKATKKAEGSGPQK